MFPRCFERASKVEIHSSRGCEVCMNHGSDKKHEPYSVDEPVDLRALTPRCRKDCCDGFDTNSNR